ncbi:periplasmic binding protein/LacI transcriptional regulator [Aurantimonas sp. 22II-16-19i]|nr:periplasmic binding protein/LacI transcriptional regulator [Aurantimonas sp. 22II-16-19i]
MNIRTLIAGSILSSACAFAAPALAQSGDISACLITKTDINPFFVKMKEGASAEAEKLGIKLSAYAGKVDGDHESQVNAVETCIADGAKGILITASDTAAITDVVKRARERGILVIALDTPLDPVDAADATFATDNFEAGRLIGAWAKASVEDPANAKIAMLDLNESQPTVGVLRDQGFLEGFGIDTGDKKRWGDETDPRVVGHEVTQGNEEGGLRAMENLLLKDPEINVVYTINEPAAAGAYEALQSAGRAGEVLIVSVDGGCPGVKNVQEGIIGATSQQYPLDMARLGIQAIAKFAETGEKPKASEGLDFTNTGVNLVTDKPVDGVPSISVQEGLDRCWG